MKIFLFTFTFGCFGRQVHLIIWLNYILFYGSSIDDLRNATEISKQRKRLASARALANFKYQWENAATSKHIEHIEPASLCFSFAFVRFFQFPFHLNGNEPYFFLLAEHSPVAMCCRCTQDTFFFIVCDFESLSISIYQVQSVCAWPKLTEKKYFVEI